MKLRLPPPVRGSTGWNVFFNTTKQPINIPHKKAKKSARHISELLLPRDDDRLALLGDIALVALAMLALFAVGAAADFTVALVSFLQNLLF